MASGYARRECTPLFGTSACDTVLTDTNSTLTDVYSPEMIEGNCNDGNTPSQSTAPRSRIPFMTFYEGELVRYNDTEYEGDEAAKGQYNPDTGMWERVLLVWCRGLRCHRWRMLLPTPSCHRLSPVPPTVTDSCCQCGEAIHPSIAPITCHF